MSNNTSDNAQSQSVPAVENVVAPRRRFSWFWFFILLIILGGGGFAGYLWFEKQNVQPIKIALVGPITGSGASNGEAMVRGAQLRIEEINARGGIQGRPVELVVYDDKGDSKEAAARAEEIVKSEAVAVIGHYNSSNSLAGSPIYLKAGIPIISGSATADRITAENEFYFRVIFNNSDQAALVANYVYKILGFKTANVISVENAFGSTLATAFMKTASEVGLDVKYAWSFKDGNKQDFEDKLREMETIYKKDVNQGILFIATSSPEALRIITTLRYAGGVRQPMIGPDSFSSSGFATSLREFPQERTRPGYYSDGIYTTAPFMAEISSRFAQQFRLNYIKRFSGDPTITAAMYYDSALVILSALEKMELSVFQEKSLKEQRVKLRDSMWAFASTETAIEGVNGAIYFDENRDVVKAIHIGLFKHGRPSPAPEQFQPSDLRRVSNILQEALNDQIIQVNNKFMRRTQVVYTGMDFLEISGVDIKNGTYVADFYIWFRFQGQGFNDKNIEFLNALEPTLSLGEPLLDQVSTLESGMITRTYRVKARFKASFDFRQYPLDKQLLTINFRHKDYQRESLIYVVDEQGMQMGRTEEGYKNFLRKYDQAMTTGGWSLRNVLYFEDSQRIDSTMGSPEWFYGNQRIEYSRLNMNLEVARNFVNFIIKNMLALVFVISMGYFIFYIPVDQFANRIGLSTNIIVTTTLFHLKLSTEMPDVDYLVLMEFFYFLMYFLAIATIIVNVQGFLLQRRLGDKAIPILRRVDLIGRFVYPLFIIMMVGIAIYTNV